MGISNNVNGRTSVCPSNHYEVANGMPKSIFIDRYSRRKQDGEFQNYAERVSDVVVGNFMLDPTISADSNEYRRTLELSMKGVMPFSGRHLQHGDIHQASRNMEVFTNCSTAAFTFMTYLLLLNGSGVGRDYSADSCRVDWDYMPNLRLILDGGEDDSGDVSKGAHPDFQSAIVEFQGLFESLRDAKHKYDSESDRVRWIKVKDSREGWAEVLAILETAAFHKNHRDALFIFDFSDVRPLGSPIKGMQNRPAQGPLPFMRALAKISTIKGSGMKPWKQALFIDHYAAACVVMGNVRRAARMATKHWRDRDVIEFIDIKRGGFLWSANNSITVDAEFWQEAKDPRPSHGRRVFEAAVAAAYFDGTGEPGFINVDKLNSNTDGFDDITWENYLNLPNGMTLHRKTYDMIDNVLIYLKKKKYPFITNPCGEIVLSIFGGYCVIGDVCLSKCGSLEEAEDAVALMAPFLIRVNRMKSMYKAEVDRTNRIGIGVTGIHEFAYRHFNCTFKDLLSEDGNSNEFWQFMWRLGRIGEKTAKEYANKLGMSEPHTVLTIKPSGTISKVMNCTEGAHLPAVLYYNRWVIFPKGSADVAEYKKRGYLVKDVSHQYTGCVVVGFPTKQPIVDVVPADKIATSDAISPEEHFKWLMLLEKYWLGGDGNNNQVSYTLKYDPNVVTFSDFMEFISKYQSQVKCCSVMPVINTSAYAYVPEETITKEEYERLASNIDRVEIEEYDESSIQCQIGSCPIEQTVNDRMTT